MRKILGSQKNVEGAYVKLPSPKPVEPFKLEDFLFDKQLKFVSDPHPFKIAVCSRRSGKTVACAADLVNTALNNPDTICLYITLSRNNAKKLVWREAKKINEKYELNGEEDQTELSITFPNNSVIYFSGAGDSSEIEKFRGLALKKVYIDECQSFREYIRDLVDDVISPALLDHAGSLCLIGTPGPIPAGYFAEVAGAVQEKKKSSEAWTHHEWTFFDNPFIPLKSGLEHQVLLQRELKRRGVAQDDPSIQREFFGRWILDSESLWIKYSTELNHYEKLPQEKFNYILGIDLGYQDADALALIGWSETSNITYLIEELVMDKQGITPLVEQINDLSKRYDISKMIVDAGGLGKKIAEEMRRRHALPLIDADKVKKQENVAFLNDALRTGKFKAKSLSKFAQDSFLVEVDWDKSTPDKIKISDKYHSDIIDAVLYAFKESNGWSYQAEAARAIPGTKQWALEETSRMFDAAVDHFKEQAELEGLFNPDKDD